MQEEFKKFMTERREKMKEEQNNIVEEEQDVETEDVPDTIEQINHFFYTGSNGEMKFNDSKLPDEEWIVDTGCTVHVTGNKQLILNYKNRSSKTFLLGNNHQMKGEGMGSTIIKILTAGGNG